MFATLVQNVGIHIGHHFGLGVTGIALHRFDVTAIEFQLVCYACMAEAMEYDRREPMFLNQLLQCFCNRILLCMIERESLC